MLPGTPPPFPTPSGIPLCGSQASHESRGIESHLVEPLHRSVHLEPDDEECQSGDTTEGAEEDGERGKVALGGGRERV